MASIVWADVISTPTAAAEFSATGAQAQSDVLAYVNSVLDVNQFDGEGGPTTRLARISLARHWLAMDKLGTGGPLTGEGDGRLTRQYAAPSMRSEYMMTSYGRAFWSLIGPQAHGPRLL